MWWRRYRGFVVTYRGELLRIVTVAAGGSTASSVDCVPGCPQCPPDRESAPEGSAALYRVPPNVTSSFAVKLRSRQSSSFPDCVRRLSSVSFRLIACLHVRSSRSPLSTARRRMSRSSRLSQSRTCRASCGPLPHGHRSALRRSLSVESSEVLHASKASWSLELCPPPPYSIRCRMPQSRYLRFQL